MMRSLHVIFKQSQQGRMIILDYWHIRTCQHTVINLNLIIAKITSHTTQNQRARQLLLALRMLLGLSLTMFWQDSGSRRNITSTSDAEITRKQYFPHGISRFLRSRTKSAPIPAFKVVLFSRQKMHLRNKVDNLNLNSAAHAIL